MANSFRPLNPLLLKKLMFSMSKISGATDGKPVEDRAGRHEQKLLGINRLMSGNEMIEKLH